MLILPDDTDWVPDPIGRADIAGKYFTKAKVPYVIIAKPAGFKGHLAGWLPIFDYRYGSHPVIPENPKSGACQVSPIAKYDFRSITDVRLVAEADKKAVSSAEGLAGNILSSIAWSISVSKYYRYVSPKQRMAMVGKNEIPEDFTFRDGLHCAGSACSRLVRWSDGYMLEFDPKTGNLDAWWIEDR